jgi:hypothetical protein
MRALMTYQPIFPAALQPLVPALLRRLEVAELASATQGTTFLVQGEQLVAPARVYYEPNILRWVIEHESGDTRILALSLGTRHWNGYVREECVRRLVTVDRPWVVPFVVQLVGEYVVEIVQVIAAALHEVDRPRFGAFVRENRKFMATTRSRVRSYWDCYYRSQFPSLQAYPATILLDEIERMA